jgi:hypothetical protein
MIGSNARVTRAVLTRKPEMFYTARLRVLWTKSNSKCAAAKFGQSAERQVDMNQFNEREDAQARQKAFETQNLAGGRDFQGARRPSERGRTAVWQARLVMLVMINLAQLWILSATVEAALAGHFKELLPLVIASGVCWLIALSIFLWWKPASRRHTSTGYLRDQ